VTSEKGALELVLCTSPRPSVPETQSYCPRAARAARSGALES
jgi:hypothetical protein